MTDSVPTRHGGIAARETAAARAEAEATASPAAARYAGLATRAIAFAVDAVVINAVVWLVAAVVALCLSLFHVPDSVHDVLVAIGAVLAVLWSVAYFVSFWSATGQTPGDRLMEIRVLDADSGRPLHAASSLLRVLGLILSTLLLCIPFLLILFDVRRRALHDRLVGSVVVYAPTETVVRGSRRPEGRRERSAVQDGQTER